MTEMNQRAWEITVDEDLEWLSQQSGWRYSDLEYRHIIDCLKWLRTHKPTDQLVSVDQVKPSVETISKLYAEIDPCLYEGKILCSACPRKRADDDDCDMKNGRELHLHFFLNGYWHGWLAHAKKGAK
jgi:hypothetical protein